MIEYSGRFAIRLDVSLSIRLSLVLAAHDNFGSRESECLERNLWLCSDEASLLSLLPFKHYLKLTASLHSRICIWIEAFLSLLVVLFVSMVSKSTMLTIVRIKISLCRLWGLLCKIRFEVFGDSEVVILHSVNLECMNTQVLQWSVLDGYLWLQIRGDIYQYYSRSLGANKCLQLVLLSWSCTLRISKFTLSM